VRPIASVIDAIPMNVTRTTTPTSAPQAPPGHGRQRDPGRLDDQRGHQQARLQR
jgi:hypothetical protein